MVVVTEKTTEAFDWKPIGFIYYREVEFIETSHFQCSKIVTVKIPLSLMSDEMVPRGLDQYKDSLTN